MVCPLGDGIESRLKKSGADTQLRYKERQEKSAPLLKEFKTWVDAQVALPKSPLGKALTYTKNQWDKVIRYCDGGLLEIDNNRDEQAVRLVAIGVSVRALRVASICSDSINHLMQQCIINTPFTRTAMNRSCLAIQSHYRASMLSTALIHKRHSIAFGKI